MHLFYKVGRKQHTCTQQFRPWVMQTLWGHTLSFNSLKTSKRLWYPIVHHITLDWRLSPYALLHHRLKEIIHSANRTNKAPSGSLGSSHTLVKCSPYSLSHLLQVLYWPSHRHGPSVQCPSREWIGVPAQKPGPRRDCLAQYFNNRHWVT